MDKLVAANHLLSQGQDLPADAIESLLPLLAEKDNQAKSAAFLALLQAKGVSADELITCVNYFLAHSEACTQVGEAIDIVGTGGDGANTLNLSTAAALVVARCGVNVVKHGNRAVSSRAGSADLIEALGYDLTRGDISEQLAHEHFAFCYAPLYHPLLGTYRSLRLALGMPTIFNLLGPLLNPARPDYLLLGVYDPSLLPLYAKVCAQMAFKRVLIVHGNGLDEITCLGPVQVVLVEDAEITSLTLDAKDYGLPYCTLADLRGGSAEENARAVKAIVNGQPHSASSSVQLMAASALYLARDVDSIAQGLIKVRSVLQQGACV